LWLLSGILFTISVVWLIIEPGLEPLYTFVGGLATLVASWAAPDKKQQSGSKRRRRGKPRERKRTSTKDPKEEHVVHRLSVGTRITVNVGALIVFVILLFSPAEEESLIIVANFADESAGQYAGIDPDNYIYSALNARIEADGLDIRVKWLDETLDANTVQQAGEAHNATLVLWGQYDSVGITLYVERIKEVRGNRTDEEGQVISLADPEHIEFSVVTDLSAMSSYLVLFTLGADLHTNEQWDAAIPYLTSAIASVSEEGVTAQPDEAYFARAFAYAELRDYGKAVRDYNQAIEFVPGNAAAYNNRGIVYHNLGDYERAIADYDRVIDLDPEYAAAYNNRGIVYHNLGDYERAIADYDRVIDLDPEYAAAYNNRGIVYHNLGDYERAIADYDRAIDLDPEYAAAYVNRGLIYHNLGDYERAIADYDRAIDLDPEYAAAYVNRGSAYGEEGRYAQAFEDFNWAIALDPENALAYLGRGTAYAEMGEQERAIEDYERALEFDPEFALAYNNRGNTYRWLGQYARAIEDYEQALEFDPEFALAYNNRGLAYRQLGNREAAIADFERVLELSDDPALRDQAELRLAELRGE
jgi:tetratricopeptide (TPR) repeat protein